MADYYSVFLDIMGDFKRSYSYLSFKKHSVEDLIRKYGPSMRTITDEGEFARQLAKILALFEDGHIAIKKSDGNTLITYKKDTRPNYNYKLTYKKYFPDGLKLQNRAGAIGLFEDVIYVNILSWGKRLNNELMEIFHFFEFAIINYKFTKKIVIDVRSNAGGDDGYAERFLSYLIPAKKKIPITRYLYRLDPDDPRKLGREYVRYCSSHAALHFEGQITALVGNECKSSNEYFVAGLESLKNYTKMGSQSRVTLIGDNTFGSSGNPKLFSHPCGIRYMIPSWVAYTSTGELLEGKGIKPDIFIPSKKTISWGKDRAFEAALKALR